jgi:hypothetical protein
MKKLKLGSKVLHRGRVCTILGYSSCQTGCVIEGLSEGHQGRDLHYWHDERGNRIPYVKGNGRWYIPTAELVPIETQEPEFIFNL